MPSIQLYRVNRRRDQAELERNQQEIIDFDITNFCANYSNAIVTARVLITWSLIDIKSIFPEPSTAIAMGLPGVVGFAGNRRRRREI